MSNALIDAKFTKRIKTPANLRKPQILALRAAGLTQQQIASKLGVSRKTIVMDLQELKPAQAKVESVLAELVGSIDALHSIKDSAKGYVDLATGAKNEAVKLATLDRIQDFRGVVTQKELVRTRRDEASQPAAMFVLNANMQVSFGPDTVTVQSAESARDITPKKDE